MIKIKVEVDLPGYKKGQIVNVVVDGNGTPKSKFWRRRLNDSKTDGCITVLAPTKKEKTQRKDK